MSPSGDLPETIAVVPGFLLETFSLSSDADDLVSFYTGDDETHRRTPVSPDPTKPYVTLTFAQSLDAKIAGADGKQLALSGNESMVMTHWMRTMHDAILVGIGTALNDDPQLNTRHLPPLPLHYPYRYYLPRPVILDSNLHISPDCKLLKNYREGRGRRPWVICSSSIDPSGSDRDAFATRSARRQALEEAGGCVLEVRADHGMISIPELLRTLRDLGIRSLMVEGGASVIKSFLAANKHPAGPDKPAAVAERNFLDMVIITIAPTLVGREGIFYGSDLLAEELPALRHLKTELFGQDAVVALRAVLERPARTEQ
ncbi:2,5-diamino-6-ribosylamino-4(3H)-pyrimidinone 5'-phosphate reductase [Sparassis crispa]|uniref:2,5-diamino-6-ribosylamino-4(3H)-pyrimidinone 5'-phosphate reductase n=1 Tax=Sparassis crispa TaxID=139825 RepID=A0A401G5K7_9APHY|nr:2,5-diamino-6-ribosylamino-4(3H)-pyrimidinone 5'-phosphate reductase [Sparassis crispa]GBE77448.1 2,5-diamino-6-ribosylamino-4(3H)-pyrimidinone 5'-phosphate reductase [Sparassis crispa]